MMENSSVFDILEEAKQEATDVTAARTAYLESLKQQVLDPAFDLNEADIRFSTALQLNRVRNALVAIIGAGGLGNWQWRILAAMGFRRIAIYDFDTVGMENVGPQCHSVFDIGLSKVAAVANAALAYRGLGIIARNKAVNTMRDIVEDLGECPDIVIGCTDSADFRNKFITDVMYDGQQQFPELWLDYRMSLGDWTAYIVPLRGIRDNPLELPFAAYRDWYNGHAVFPESEAVQEPCTERAIAYTGANVASFTGAVLHWYYSGGRQKMQDMEFLASFMLGKNSDTAIRRMVSFSSRDFEFITNTATERKLLERLRTLEDMRAGDWKVMLYGLAGIEWDVEVITTGYAAVRDAAALRESYAGNYLITMADGKVEKLLIGKEGFLDIADINRYNAICAVSSWHGEALGRVPYCVVANPNSKAGFAALAQAPRGTWFAYGNMYVRLMDDGVAAFGGHDVNAFADDFCTDMLPDLILEKVTDADVLARLNGSDGLHIVSAADLAVGMVITLDTEPDSEQLEIIETGEHIRVRSLADSSEFVLSKRSLQHMYKAGAACAA